MPSTKLMVVKRNGDLEPFALGRIALAVFRAGQAQRPPLAAFDGRRLGADVSLAASAKFIEEKRERVGVEEVQDAVVASLRALGRGPLADSYQSYREERMQERGKISHAKRAEKGFRFEAAAGRPALEMERQAWAGVLHAALERGAKNEWTVAEWWAASKDQAGIARTFDDFVGVHIRALLEASAEREHWLGSASALLLERWHMRVCGAGPLLHGLAEAGKAARAHYKAYWADRRGRQKDHAPWFPSPKELDAIGRHFDPERDRQLNFSGLALMERNLGTGAEALLPQEIFANCAVALVYAGRVKGSEAERLASCLTAWNRFASGRLIAPLNLMRQARNANPSIAQECHLGFDDSLESIFEGLAKTAVAVKFGSSVSVDISALRAEGSPVGSEGQASGGVAPVLRLFGEACGMLRGVDGEDQKARVSMACWHRDLESFLAYAKIAPKEMRLSVSMPDSFMRKVFEGGDWVLASPSEAPHLVSSRGADFDLWAREYAQMAKFGGLGLAKSAPAREVFDWVCQAIASADGPSVVFSDACVSYESPDVGAVLSGRMSAVMPNDGNDCGALELGLSLDGCSWEECLEAFVEAHQLMRSMSFGERRVQLAVAPVGSMGREDFARLLAAASRRLDGPESLPKSSLWRSANPWLARAKAIESSRGGYVEREEEAWEEPASCNRAGGPAQLVSLSSREEYLSVAGANPLFVNHEHHRRQVWFEGARVGFGGSGDFEPVKRQVRRAAAWQRWSDGALALDVRLAHASPSDIGEAIKLAWLHSLVGVRRFVGPRP